MFGDPNDLTIPEKPKIKIKRCIFCVWVKESHVSHTVIIHGFKTVLKVHLSTTRMPFSILPSDLELFANDAIPIG
jgi:hypothetical protein